MGHIGKFLVVSPEQHMELLAGQVVPVNDEVFKNGLIGMVAPEERRLSVRCKCGTSSCWIERDLGDGRKKYISANPPGIAAVRFARMIYENDRDILV